jgi:hypothetical protein
MSFQIKARVGPSVSTPRRLFYLLHLISLSTGGCGVFTRVPHALNLQHVYAKTKKVQLKHQTDMLAEL